MKFYAKHIRQCIDEFIQHTFFIIISLLTIDMCTYFMYSISKQKKKQNKNTQREGEKTRTRNENTHRFKLDNGNRLHKFFSLHLEEGGFAMACYCLCHGMPCNCFASNFDGICKIPPNLHC